MDYYDPMNDVVRDNVQASRERNTKEWDEGKPEEETKSTDHDCHAGPEDGCFGCEKINNLIDGE